MTATAADHIAVDSNLALIIDDDAELRQFIAATLKQLGMRVADFDMAKDALASLDSVHPAIIFSTSRCCGPMRLMSCAASASAGMAARCS